MLVCELVTGVGDRWSFNCHCSCSCYLQWKRRWKGCRALWGVIQEQAKHSRYIHIWAKFGENGCAGRGNWWISDTQQPQKEGIWNREKLRLECPGWSTLLRKEIKTLEFSTGIIKQDLALSHNLDCFGYSKYINFQLRKKKWIAAFISAARYFFWDPGDNSSTLWNYWKLRKATQKR